ncbi:DUF6061 family protein [Cloacibacillus porcorum]
MKITSYKFNMDTACLGLRLDDGTLIAIVNIAMENEIADNMYEWPDLDYMIYNAPAEYTDLILYSNPVCRIFVLTHVFMR